MFFTLVNSTEEGHICRPPFRSFLPCSSILPCGRALVSHVSTPEKPWENYNSGLGSQSKGDTLHGNLEAVNGGASLAVGVGECFSESVRDILGGGFFLGLRSWVRKTRERTRKKNRAESFSERKNQRVRGFLGGGKEEQVGLERVLWQLQELSEQARPLKSLRGAG